jgi:hypothetical protein
MKKYAVEKRWLESGMPLNQDLYESVYLASDVSTLIAEQNRNWDDAAKERVQHLTRISELEKALRLIVSRVEMFDDDGGLSKYDPSVTDAKALLRTPS